MITMEKENLKSLKMREQPIGRLLLNMSLPAILSMLVQALYNIVDSIFVGNYGPKVFDGATVGARALSLAFPLQMLTTAFAIGIGVGTNVVIAKKLGEGKRDEANSAAQTGLVLSLIFTGIFIILAFTVVKPFVNANSVEAEIAEQTVIYLTICMSCSIGTFVEICCSKILQGTGNMKIPMISQMIGAGTNIILDPIFIFDWGFGLGVAGAAWATVIGQIAAMAFVLIMFTVKKHDVSIGLKGFRFKKSNVLNIAVIGLPTMVMNAITAFTILIFNFVTLNLLKFKNAYTILGYYFKLQSFVFMPVFGLMQGTLPILSYNYGWGNKKRYMRCYRLSTIVSLSIMTVGLLLFQIFPDFLVKIFGAEGVILQEGAYALRIISICFIPAAFCIVLTTAFQSLGKGVPALLMSLLRQLIFLLPIAILFGWLFGQNALWFGYPISEALVLCIFMPIALTSMRKKFALVSDENGLPLNPDANPEIKTDEISLG